MQNTILRSDTIASMSNLLITHANIITMTQPNHVVRDGSLLITDGVIAQISEGLIAAPAGATTIDAGGKYLLPGNICSHTHFYGAFARGLYIPGAPAKNFVEILQKLWWRLDRALDIEGSKYSALVCLVDAIKHGTTTLIDHHASPDAIEGSLDAIADAVADSGLRAGLCYEVTDRNGMDGAKRGIEENVRFAKRILNSEFRIQNLAAAFGVHAQFTVSDATLDTCAGLANELGIPLHIHVAEDNADELEAIKHHNMRAVQRLARHNALNSKSMLAHCIHIDEAEMELVKAAGAKVMHQPRSNMNNGVGAARVQTMLERGICVGLGNDGFSNDAFAEMTICDKLHKVTALDPRAMGADKITGMVYQNNAKIAQMFFPQTTGVLAAGSPGDVILMDYHPFTEIHKDNVPWHMVFGMDGGMVTHTIVGGRMLMADRKLLTLDEAEIAAKGKEVSGRAWKKFWQICEAEGDK